MPALTSSLSEYLADTRRLLRDNSAQTYPDTDLIPWINLGIYQRDLDLGINRVKYSFPMTTGQFTYSFAQIQSGTLLFGPANQAPIDVVSITVIPLGTQQAGIRYPMGRWPYSKLAYLLSTSYPTYPVKFALYGPGTVVVGPPPANPYPTEWDMTVAQPPLVNLTDTDPIPRPWTLPVPYWAAHLAKLNTQRYDEADKFEAEYGKMLRRVIARGRPMAIPNPLNDLPRSAR